MKVFALLSLAALAQGVKITGDVNPFSGLKNGGKEFAEGGKVGGVNTENYAADFKGPATNPVSGENPAHVNTLTITKSQGNGHGIDKRYPFRGPY